MDTQLSQVAMIMTRANAVLMGQYQLEEDLFTTHNIFQHDQSVSFTKKVDSHHEILATNPNEWIQYLLDSKAAFIHFRVLWNDKSKMTEPQLAGFVGGGMRYVVEVINLDNTHDLYIPRQQVNPKEDDGEKTWLINYELVKTIPNIGVNIRTVEEVTNDLKEVLINIEEFARAQKLSNFAYCFAKSLNILMQEKFQEGDDILIEGFLSEKGAALIQAASRSWVFAGMGSWNDVSFNIEEDQKQYEDLSHKLYLLLYEALEVGLASWVQR